MAISGLRWASFLRRSGPESAKGRDVAISGLRVRTARLPRFAPKKARLQPSHRGILCYPVNPHLPSPDLRGRNLSPTFSTPITGSAGASLAMTAAGELSQEKENPS